jgi:hypothetical protein
MAEYREKNRERLLEYQREYYQENLEQVRQYYAENKERFSDYQTEWRAANPDKVKVQLANANARRRADIGKQRLPNGYKQAMIAVYGPTCMFPGCESTDVTFDHVEPLSVSKDHSLRNGQLLCRPHNSAKKNFYATDYRDHSKGILVDTFGR